MGASYQAVIIADDQKLSDHQASIGRYTAELKQFGYDAPPFTKEELIAVEVELLRFPKLNEINKQIEIIMSKVDREDPTPAALEALTKQMQAISTQIESGNEGNKDLQRAIAKQTIQTINSLQKVVVDGA